VEFRVLRLFEISIRNILLDFPMVESFTGVFIKL
jgi:hypothetical protein